MRKKLKDKRNLSEYKSKYAHRCLIFSVFYIFFYFKIYLGLKFIIKNIFRIIH